MKLLSVALVSVTLSFPSCYAAALPSQLSVTTEGPEHEVVSRQTAHKGLLWPMSCVPNDGLCADFSLTGWKDDGGKAYNCDQPGYTGHTGHDFQVNGFDAMDAGINVLAAHSGTVVAAQDGRYDRCVNGYEHTDCWLQERWTLCHQWSPEEGYWQEKCWFAGNGVIIQADNGATHWGTIYAHMKNGSITVKAGDRVTAGQVIGQVGSSGHTTGPHLHFEVVTGNTLESIDPFSGACSDNPTSLWNNNDAPWLV